MSETIHDLMHTDIVCVKKNVFVIDVIHEMADKDIGCALVTDQGRLYGIFTEHDLLKRVIAKGLSPDEVQVGDVSSTNPITVTDHHPLVELTTPIREFGFGHMPVLNESHKAIGIISSKDVLDCLLANDSPVYNL